MTERLIERSTRALERVALVLAALYGDRLGDATQGEKAERLSRLGFSNAQIADALGSSENSINVSRVAHRKKNGKRKRGQPVKKKLRRKG